MTTRINHNNGPLVSVLMCTYNRPRYLRQALASALAQTWTNIEVILVRDGGEPVGRTIADFLDDVRLTLIDRDQNRGKPYSLNEALASARGEYVCYLDDDDMFYPFHVETLLCAILRQDRCQAVYSDLYKTHCRTLPGGRRLVLAKNTEVSRDFDRMLMLQFNHVLHVSLLHRRDLLDRTGPYNERLNVLVDWDMTRRLCFYTDFLHVPQVTGEYYAPVGDCDRISVKRRKDVAEYRRNVQTIRGTRPPKPWPCMYDLSVILTTCRTESPAETLRRAATHIFYPARFFVPLTAAQQTQFDAAAPNTVPVPVHPGASEDACIDAALEICDGDFVAVVPGEATRRFGRIPCIEWSLYPLLRDPQNRCAYELAEAAPDSRGVVVRRDALLEARKRRPHLPLLDSLRADGIAIRKPGDSDYPFRLDNILHVADEHGRQGQWAHAVALYDQAAERFGNTLWIQTLKANALYQQGRWEQAAVLAEQLNDARPTAARLLIEARARRRLNDYAAAAALYRRAETILDGHSVQAPQGRPAAAAEDTAAAFQTRARHQENLIWTS